MRRYMTCRFVQRWVWIVFSAGLSDLGPDTAPLTQRTVLVAWDGGEMRGWVDFGLGTRQIGDAGIIRWLSYRRGERATGQVLLDAAENALLGMGVRAIEAFPQEYRYPFHHLKAAYLSDRLAHVAALFRFNGYAIHRGEVFLEWGGSFPARTQSSAVGYRRGGLSSACGWGPVFGHSAGLHRRPDDWGV